MTLTSIFQLSALVSLDYGARLIVSRSCKKKNPRFPSFLLSTLSSPYIGYNAQIALVPSIFPFSFSLL